MGVGRVPEEWSFDVSETVNLEHTVCVLYLVEPL